MAANVIRKVKMSAYLWDWIFKRLCGFEMPDKIGETSWDNDQRGIVKDEVRHAVVEMKRHSYYAQKLGPDNRLCFGAQEDWEEVRDDKQALIDLKQIKPEKEYVLAFGEAAVSGICWWAYVSLTPPNISHEKVQGNNVTVFSHHSTTPIQGAAFVWPLIEGLGRVKALREAVGLDKSEKKRRWENDPVTESETSEIAGQSPKPEPKVIPAERNILDAAGR